MSDAPERLAPGTVLDLGRRYRIERFLGAGGFAEVYKAEEIGIGRLVALKLLGVGAHARATHKQRFFREAQAAARIRHRDVVTILEHGVAPDGRPFIAQDFLDGYDLAEALQRHGSLAPDRALRLFVGAFDALAAAHEAGVVHRDLKPANLFLDQPDSHRERLVVLDFGVAFLHEQLDDRLTATGGFLGTPRYMAPEYIEQRTVSPAMDVYQLALVLVETLSGRPAVDAENAYQSMVAHVNGQLVVPLWLEASALGPLLRAALDVDPTRRPAPGELRDALARIDVADVARPAVDPGLADAETVDSGRLGVAETAESDEAGPSGGVPTLDPQWVELVPERPRTPPPIPYAAYLRDRPATEALSLSLFDPEAADGTALPVALREALRKQGPDATVRVEPAAPSRRRGWAVAVAAALVALAGAVAALQWTEDERAPGDRAAIPTGQGPAPFDGGAVDVIVDGMDGIDGIRDGSTNAIDMTSDAAVDAAAGSRNERIRRSAQAPPRRAERPERPPAGAAPASAAAPAGSGLGAPPGDAVPTASDLLRWRTGLPVEPPPAQDP